MTSHSSESPRLGDVVLYCHVVARDLDGRPSSSYERAAMVTHVHPDGRTVDLVVMHDGDPSTVEARRAWAHGHSVVVSRLDIPAEGDLPRAARFWRYRAAIVPQ